MAAWNATAMTRSLMTLNRPVNDDLPPVRSHPAGADRMTR